MSLNEEVWNSAILLYKSLTEREKSKEKRRVEFSLSGFVKVVEKEREEKEKAHKTVENEKREKEQEIQATLSLQKKVDEQRKRIDYLEKQLTDLHKLSPRFAIFFFLFSFLIFP
jgi:hypothetical protein